MNILQKSAVLRIDQLLSGQGNPSLETLQAQLVRQLLALANSNASNPGIDSEQEALRLLRTSIPADARSAITAALLRILHDSRCDWVRQNPWRPIVIEFIEGAVGPEFYGPHVTASAQNHQKMEALAAAVNFLETSLARALSELSRVAQYASQRKALLALLNGNKGRHLFLPWLPTDATKWLRDIYARTEEYVSHSDDYRAADIAQAALGDIRQCKQRLEEHGTHYAVTLARDVASKLEGALSRDLASNSAAHPAALEIEGDSKKYPLHRQHDVLMLTFRIRNLGPGYAHDVWITAVGGGKIEIPADPFCIGRLDPNSIYPVDVSSRVSNGSQEASLQILLEWRNSDGTQSRTTRVVPLSGQATHVEWDQLLGEEPYSLEPVESDSDLVGRGEMFQRLLATVLARNAGSVILHGQKRVGKTSLAKALKARLEKLGHSVIYLEAGDYIAPHADATISRLGEVVCGRLRKANISLSALPTPSFSHGLAPIAEFLDAACSAVLDESKIVLILDEFDQLPLELYHRDGIGNSFFLTLRSVTSRPQVAFVVVGGERMTRILDLQGQQLNKWKSITVDYFTLPDDWPDYKELIQRPVEGVLEYSEDGIREIHRVSAGNPFFSNMICQRVFEQAVRNRDSHVTEREAGEATKTALRSADRNTFQHFWDDGILEEGLAALERSTRRRKVLLAVADVLRRGQEASASDVSAQTVLKGMAAVDGELKDLASRRVLVGGDPYQFKVPLFNQWLRGRGVHEVIASFHEGDIALRQREEEALKEVAATDVVEIVSRWGLYRAQKITEDRVRAWLSQFGGSEEQQLMFKILRALRFYSNSYVRSKLHEIDAIVRAKTVHRVESRKTKRSDILVSYLDHPAKSGAQLAGLYVDETGLYVDCVVERGRISEQILARPDVQALVFVDDFVGTGQSLLDYMSSLGEALISLIQDRGVLVVVGVVCAYHDGWLRIQREAEKWPFQHELHVCEVLDKSSRCFGKESAVFDSPAEIERAREIAQLHGRELEPKCALGFGDLQLAVTFERGCPNNTLPILWSKSRRWVPLFARM